VIRGSAYAGGVSSMGRGEGGFLVGDKEGGRWLCEGGILLVSLGVG
jgi:hypothetical protein